jgi:hypothetical protein
MDWDAYEARSATEWNALLNSVAGCEERQIHDFLARHPCWVPGAHRMDGMSGRAPTHCALLSESPLREWHRPIDAYRDAPGIKVPDFIWFARDPDDCTPVLIEIDSPCKKWFTDQGAPHPDLVQSMNHLDQWRGWLSRPENEMAFCAYFSFYLTSRQHSKFRPEFALIYGREDEILGRPDLIRLRSHLQKEDRVLLTFDDLKPLRDCRGYISATHQADGFRALAFPATIRLGPAIAGAWRGIRGTAEAVLANSWISSERKSFLVDRLPYWNRWAVSSRRLTDHVDFEDRE